uniref:ORF3 protein n=1 Tax=Streptomyces phage phiC31 TaxID=10719 RepID=Q37984_BPPHC|nr:ORF3 [Lomovskayavirus C31]
MRKNPPFVIFDEVMGDYCALPQDDDGEPVTLEWRSRSAAYDWLAHCLQTWQMWERTGRAADVPKAWRGFPCRSNRPGWVTRRPSMARTDGHTEAPAATLSGCPGASRFPRSEAVFGSSAPTGVTFEFSQLGA